MLNTGRLLQKAARQMTNDFDQFAKKYDLTSMQMSFIDYLSDHPQTEVLQRDLEQEFNIRRSTATLILQRMEKKHLVVRKTSQVDARQRAVFLTEQSQAIVQVIKQYMKQEQTQLEQHFSTAQVQIFEEMLTYYQQGGRKKNEN